jgi:hypothetical protein
MNSRFLLAFAAAAVACGLCSARAWAVGPEIFDVEPNQAAAGEEIRITGRKLRDAREVLFCSGYTLKPAKFKPVSEGELRVIVPDYFLADRRAIIAVITKRGTAVGMPATVVEIDDSRAQHPSRAPFYHVHKGGVLASAGGVTVIEGKGVVSEASQASAVFVKRGGTLLRYRNPAGVVLYEPGANLGEKFNGSDRNAEERQVRLVAVPTISTSLGIEPFTFGSPRQAAGVAKTAPHVQAIVPPQAGAGQVVSLRGRGFLQTQDVFFSNGLSSHDAFRRAGFQAISDSQLRVVVPDAPAPDGWELLIVVVNPLGATVTVPPPGNNLQSMSPAAQHGRGFYWMDRNELRKSTGGTFCFIDQGDILAKSAGLTFIKNGGQCATPQAGQIFHEPDALFPRATRNGRNEHPAPTLDLSVVFPMFSTPPQW